MGYKFLQIKQTSKLNILQIRKLYILLMGRFQEWKITNQSQLFRDRYNKKFRISQASLMDRELWRVKQESWSMECLKEGITSKGCRFDEAQAYEIGDYNKRQRRGKLAYFIQDIEIGGGQQNDFGKKIGKWVDLSDTFWKENQVLYFGEYNNRIKVGAWNILSDVQQIEGGSYEDFEKGEKKIGKWIDLSEFFDQQVLI
ncbi:unnamed protein product [Paramecium sonneborni]|uniref:Uncharacterized protein n=1 Tax=Paramecium sonneborni TaxID=65129 RepID=A0A8S1RUM8_9CILI|nr:unnamed protein product [Paramecium sonneborni]